VTRGGSAHAAAAATGDTTSSAPIAAPAVNVPCRLILTRR
jgi:hypothetical protein